MHTNYFFSGRLVYLVTLCHSALLSMQFTAEQNVPKGTAGLKYKEYVEGK
jgi:hypothetical protein